MKREVRWLVCSDCMGVTDNVRVAGAVKRDIVDRILRVGNTYAANATHATWACTVVAFHVHHHRDRRNVAKDQDEECTEGKERITERIICVNANSETEELLDGWPEEGIEVDRLLGTRNDPDSKDVFEMSSNVRAEVVIEQDKGPGSLCAPFEGGEAISGQAKCDIALILEELVRELLPVNSDVLAEESAVVLGIRDVADNAWGMLLLFLVAVTHCLCHRFAGEKCFEAWDDGQVHKSLARFARGVVAGLIAVWASGLRQVRPRKCTTRIDTTINKLRLKAGQTSDTGLDLLPSRYVAVGENKGKLREGLAWHVRVDLERERP